MGQGYASVDTLQPGRAAMVKGRVKPGTPGTHSERHSKVPEEGPGWVQEGSWGLGVCEWPWGKPASHLSLPFAVLHKCPLQGEMPDPSSDGCSGLSQALHRKRLPDLPSKSQGVGRGGGAGGEKAAGAGRGFWSYKGSGPSPSLLYSHLPSHSLPSRPRW